jgi:hypothetical protein
MSTIKSYTDYMDSKQMNEEAEGVMYKKRLSDIIENSKKLLKVIQDNDDLEAWVQDKITIADHNLDAILSYMETGKETPSSSTNNKPLFSKED